MAEIVKTHLLPYQAACLKYKPRSKAEAFLRQRGKSVTACKKTLQDFLTQAIDDDEMSKLHFEKAMQILGFRNG